MRSVLEMHVSPVQVIQDPSAATVLKLHISPTKSFLQSLFIHTLKLEASKRNCYQ